MDLKVYIALKTVLNNPDDIAHTEDTDDLHITLIYGWVRNTTLTTEEAEKRVEEAISEVTNDIPEKIQFDETGRFDASESSDGKDVIYARVQQGQLEALRSKLLRILRNMGMNVVGDFEVYRPHMTLGYVEPGLPFRKQQLSLSADIPQAVYGVEEEDSEEPDESDGKEPKKEEEPEETKFMVKKSVDDQQLVFGWANVSERKNGEQVLDLQGDMVSPQELEKAVYEYVLNWHTGGEEHNPMLQNKCRLVESVVFTDEKLKAMGIPQGTVPLGWWIGFKVDDPRTWELVKNGTYQMFSIAGQGKRVPMR